MVLDTSKNIWPKYFAYQNPNLHSDEVNNLDYAILITFSELTLEHTSLPVLYLEHLNIPRMQINKIATNLFSMYMSIYKLILE